MATKVRNITELRNDLLVVYSGVRSGSMDLKTAKEAANTAGKIISSVKVQLEYAAVRSETPSIAFID